ncbi:MAG TPA: endolytic transglycosylase MltG [Jatrophihabitantaceae bacterium]|nr:endolytic transglycosylase MltG [Jatrophihabitantaceae bacterium]
MTSRESEPMTDQEPHLLFGEDEAAPLSRHEQLRATRAERHHHRRVRRSRRMFAIVSSVVAIVLVVLAVAGYRVYQDRYHPKDYSGAGTGRAVVVVKQGDGAASIGNTLADAGVVASSRAFRNAASDNSDAQNIQPGTYELRKHMSAKNAVSLLLDPSSRLSNSLTVVEGATVLDLVDRLAKALGIAPERAAAALKDVSKLGLPNGYSAGTATPSTVEGFLYPATYSFDPGTSPQDAIQEMITKFIDEDRTSDFAAHAAARHLSPYEALIMASIEEKEANNPDDYAKVARVILNRIAARMPLQIDATSVYGARLLGLDPKKVVYSELDSPYNSYTHRGLPPTPIANPGAEAMNAAVNPASGNWLYYVNGDKAGNLFFTNDPDKFAAAVARCRDNNWGCG